MATDERVRLLRALSALARASRDLDALVETAHGHLHSVLLELSADAAFSLRRLTNVAKLQGVPPEAIESAKR